MRLDGFVRRRAVSAAGAGGGAVAVTIAGGRRSLHMSRLRGHGSNRSRRSGASPWPTAASPGLHAPQAVTNSPSLGDRDRRRHGCRGGREPVGRHRSGYRVDPDRRSVLPTAAREDAEDPHPGEKRKRAPRQPAGHSDKPVTPFTDEAHTHSRTGLNELAMPMDVIGNGWLKNFTGNGNENRPPHLPEQAVRHMPCR